MDFIEQVIVQLIEHNYELITCTFCSPLGTSVLLDQNGKNIIVDIILFYHSSLPAFLQLVFQLLMSALLDWSLAAKWIT